MRTTSITLSLAAMLTMVGCSSGTAGSEQTDAASETTDTAFETTDTASETPQDGALPDGRCRNAKDCKSSSFQLCLATGESAGCGIDGGPGECSTDDTCKSKSAGTVCELTLCAGGQCVPACTAATVCPEGQACGALGHCAPMTCGATSPCPRNFSCTSSTCLRKSCASDGDCGGRACVNGHCYDALGTCASPAA